MQLSRSRLQEQETLFELPEKVLQFGTGVLLRGLPDYFINKANRQQLFNGRIVVVKSTDSGGTDAFKQQDNIFTQLERGYENGQHIERTTINTAISRVLSAKEEWDEILNCAANPAMQLIISNTTEVGITLLPDDAKTAQPVSFPGRILMFLEKRYETFNGNEDAGMVIIPTELITGNGAQLKSIVLELATLKGCDEAFMNWLRDANDFCNSLVDRIVPGKLSKGDTAGVQQQLGYDDELMIMSECYRLWAIETRCERTKNILSFSGADDGVVIAPDINKYRELKLRLLNGTHTFSCGLAHLLGFATVKEAMRDETFAAYVMELMLDEIAPLIAGDEISITEANSFAAQVIDRFRNNYIEHLWMNITVQYTSKMAMRNVPLLQRHYQLNRNAPKLMAIGFAAYVLFMKPGTAYQVQDEKAVLTATHWNNHNNETGRVNAILSDKLIWGNDLTIYAGFAEMVSMYLTLLMDNDAMATLRSVINKRSVA